MSVEPSLVKMTYSRSRFLYYQGYLHRAEGVDFYFPVYHVDWMFYQDG
ncbi:hypothetical protein BJP36_41535 [Moorena producens JHB]|uniref:Uncharacterized protein n=1 Tax=Moorena producens (strain JHB) TaxID=1454205 RepID=A0A9Q9SSK8_MOOP1|nr:hypothetical protein [Moorena producens]WAN68848.1 hypothetical protein BJP36_41535 [Moorena producens JHB]